MGSCCKVGFYCKIKVSSWDDTIGWALAGRVGSYRMAYTKGWALRLLL